MFTIHYSANIIAIVLLLVGVRAQEASTSIPENESLTLLTSDEYFDGLFDYNHFEGNWVSGSDNLIELQTYTKINVYNIATGENRTVLEFKGITDEWYIWIKNVMFSDDRTFVLVQGTPTKKVINQKLCSTIINYK